MIFFHKKGSTRFAVIQLMNPDKSPQAHVGGAALKRARAVSLTLQGSDTARGPKFKCF